MIKPNRHHLLQEFLQTWPLLRVQQMPLTEYAIGSPNSQDSFCYWIETKLTLLGNISGFGGGGSFKFGIFYKTSGKQYDNKRYVDDGTYAWESKFGQTRSEAFAEVKKRVLETIRNAMSGNFLQIDKIDKLFPLVKWKIAFLYSNYQLTPIYKKDWIDAVASGLGFTGPASSHGQKQEFIITQKPATQDFFLWYDWLLQTFAKTLRNYFVIGSSYHDTVAPKLKEFYNKAVIATGFMSHISLEKVFNTPRERVDQFLERQSAGKYEDQALRQFLSVKAGDIIAVKEFGTPVRLKIVAYAIVVADQNGIVYWHDPDGLGHCINVDYLDTGVNLELSLPKTQTVQRIEKTDEIKSIFGAYQLHSNEDDNKRRGRAGTTQKHTTGYQRKVAYSGWIAEFHNQLQQQFFQWLKTEKGERASQCIMEEDYVDVTFRTKTHVELYEVKTSPTAEKCIRDAIGQLVYYSAYESSDLVIKLFVVGPSPLRSSDKRMLDHVTTNFSIEFSYIDFALQEE